MLTSSLQPFAQKTKGRILNFKVGKPQRTQRSWAGSLALPIHSCHSYLPLLLLGREPPANPCSTQTHLDVLPVPLLLPGRGLDLVVGGVGAQGTPNREPGDRAGTRPGAASPPDNGLWDMAASSSEGDSREWRPV